MDNPQRDSSSRSSLQHHCPSHAAKHKDGSKKPLSPISRASPLRPNSISKPPSATSSRSARSISAKSSPSAESADNEPQQAPNDLFLRFLTELMAKRYSEALILCQGILDLEPNHTDAKEFRVVLQEKIKLDKEAEEARLARLMNGNGNDDEDDDEDEDDEASSTGTDTDGSNNSSEETTDEEDTDTSNADTDTEDPSTLILEVTPQLRDNLESTE